MRIVGVWMVENEGDVLVEWKPVGAKSRTQDRMVQEHYPCRAPQCQPRLLREVINTLKALSLNLSLCRQRESNGHGHQNRSQNHSHGHASRHKVPNAEQRHCAVSYQAAAAAGQIQGCGCRGETSKPKNSHPAV